MSETPLNNDQDQYPPAPNPTRNFVIFLQVMIYLLSKHWLLIANLFAGTILAMAFLAPLFMFAGWADGADYFYKILAPHDHQLPHRAYFLFGQNGLVQSYSLEQVLALGADSTNLRSFIGNPEIGYKMALNHRMTAIFAGIFFSGVFWAWNGRKPKLGLFWFLLLIAPLLIDGFTHLNAEENGSGFRSNQWAIALTGGTLSEEFYAGSTVGTLNWWLRTINGLMFGVGFTWYLYTFLDYRFTKIHNTLRPRLRKLNLVK